MEVWKIIFLSKWVICRFHVNLSGCCLFVCLFVCLALATCKYQGKQDVMCMRKTIGQEWTGMSFQPTVGKETKTPKE